MISSETTKFLRCPQDHSELTIAGNDIVSRVNLAIRAGRVTNHAGSAVTEPLEAALVRADGTVVYPVVDGIPVLIPADAIWLEQIDAG